MVIEIIEISTKQAIPHEVIAMGGDGACLFRALSYFIFGTQEKPIKARRRIANYVRAKWSEFSYLTYTEGGDNYKSSKTYQMEMNRADTYGGLCELIAAGQVYQYVFEVYRNGKLYMKAGSDGNPIVRLKFSNDLNNGHFDVYVPI